MRKQAKKLNGGASTNPIAVARKVRKQLPDKSMKAQFDTIADPLSHQDFALMSYLTTLGDPWVEDPAGVPLILGNAAIRTLKAQEIFEVQVKANASGFGFVAVAMDGWIQQGGGVANTYAAYNGGVQGTPIWYTDNTYVGTTLPINTATTATTGLLSQALTLLDPQMTTTTSMRLVAAGIQVFSDAAVNTAQGKIGVIATSLPYASSTNGGLSGSNYATLASLPADVASFQTAPAAGWKSGHRISAVAIPNDPDCFAWQNPPPSGTTVFSYPQLGAILSGGASGQTFTARIVFDYEFTIGRTNITGVEADPVITVGNDRIANGIAAMSHPNQSAVHFGPAGNSGITTGKGIQAAIHEMALTRPAKVQQLIRPMQSSFGSALVDTALGFAKTHGKKLLGNVLSLLPGVGGTLGRLLM